MPTEIKVPVRVATDVPDAPKLTPEVLAALADEARKCRDVFVTLSASMESLTPDDLKARAR